MNPFEIKNPENDRFPVDVSRGITIDFRNPEVTVKSKTDSNQNVDLSRQTILDGILFYLYGITTKKYIETLDDFLLGIVPEEDIIKIRIKGKAHAYSLTVPTAETMQYLSPSSILYDMDNRETFYPTIPTITLDVAKGGFKIGRKDPLFSEKLRDLTLNTLNVNSYLRLFYNNRKDAGINDIMLSQFSRMMVQETIFPDSSNKSISEKTGSISFTVKSNVLENTIIIEDYNISFNIEKYIKNEN